MRSQHIWKERDATGKKREVRVTKFGGVWRFQAKEAGELEWTYYERPLFHDLLMLKDVIFRKYQRRRASAEDVDSVEKLIQEREVIWSASAERSVDGASGDSSKSNKNVE